MRQKMEIGSCSAALRSGAMESSSFIAGLTFRRFPFQNPYFTALNVPLNDGASIYTGADEHVQISLPDETPFTMDPGGWMVIDEFYL